MPTECPAADGSSPKRQQFDAPPPMCIDPSRSYTAEMVTSKGSMTIALDPAAAPKTVNNFVVLARYHYFDGVGFHRIIPGFVIQGGDPTGTGTGGPGYKTVDEPPRDARYTKGVVAMAKAGNEPPGTAGSQFYVVTGADAGLPPDYAILGKVTKGLAVAERIGELGDPASGGAGTPMQTVVIEKTAVRTG